MTFNNNKRSKDGVHFYHLLGFTTGLREHSFAVGTSNRNPKTCELNHCATLKKNPSPRPLKPI